MAKTIKFKCDTFGFLPETAAAGPIPANPDSYTLDGKLEWNFNTSDIVMIGDENEGYPGEYVPVEYLEKYNVPPGEYDLSDIVFPAAKITSNDIMWLTGLPTSDSDLGVYHQLVNLNLGINVEDERIEFGDIKEATKATEMLANALAAKPGAGIIDLGDLEKLGYVLVYSLFTSYPRATDGGLTPFNPEP